MSGALCSGASWRTSASRTPRRSTRRTEGRWAAGSPAATWRARTICSGSLAPASTQQLNAFLRYERYNTQAGVPDGVTRDDALARRITTFGLSYKPVYNVVFKGDYQLRRNGAGVGEDEQLAWGWDISSSRMRLAVIPALALLASAGLSATARGQSRLRPSSPSRSSGSTARARRWTRCTSTPRRSIRVSAPGLAAGVRPGPQRQGEGSADHLPRGHRLGRRAARHRCPGLSRAVRRRGRLRAVAQAVPRQDARATRCRSGRTSASCPERPSAPTP